MVLQHYGCHDQLQQLTATIVKRPYTVDFARRSNLPRKVRRETSKERDSIGSVFRTSMQWGS